MLRLTNKEDKSRFVKVYSDEKSVPFFNSDNCGEDDFHYTTENRMGQAIEYWLWSIRDKDLSVGRLFQRQRMKR